MKQKKQCLIFPVDMVISDNDVAQPDHPVGCGWDKIKERCIRLGRAQTWPWLATFFGDDPESTDRLSGGEVRH
jgi:hypothetical protein